MSQATEGDLVEVAGQLRRSVAGELQHLEMPRSWLGTEGVNIFRLLLQLINVVEQRGGAAGRNHLQPYPRQRASSREQRSHDRTKPTSRAIGQPALSYH